MSQKVTINGYRRIGLPSSVAKALLGSDATRSLGTAVNSQIDAAIDTRKKQAYRKSSISFSEGWESGLIHRS